MAAAVVVFLMIPPPPPPHSVVVITASPLTRRFWPIVIYVHCADVTLFIGAPMTVSRPTLLLRASVCAL